jgi:hypothetical protein
LFTSDERTPVVGDSHDIPCHYQPSPEEVADLIERAKHHPFGLEFLKNGSLESVAAVFRVHAFTVDAARRELGVAREEPRQK